MSILQNIKALKSSMLKWDAHHVRADFPILKSLSNNKPLIYLDNASTSQKPKFVIELTNHFMAHENSNVHRGVYPLAEQASDHFESVRETVRTFIHAKSTKEIIFTKGTTESINLVAHSFGNKFLKKGDEVILSALEHHANIVPWQMLRDSIGIHIKVIPLKENGQLDLSAYERLFTERTKLVSIIHISNVLGTVNPIKNMIKTAHQHGAVVLIDGAQAVPHEEINVVDLDCDFYVFSSHKLYGPTGVGILYGKEKLLNAMPPYQGGGDMIKYVSFEKTFYNDLPLKFEAGTPNVIGVIGLGAAIDYLKVHGLENIKAYEESLLDYALNALREVKDLKILGTPTAPIISFELDHIHPHDIATILGQDGIAVRAGHHCAMPTLQALGLVAATRASFAFYNTFAEIDALVNSLNKINRMFKK